MDDPVLMRRRGTRSLRVRLALAAVLGLLAIGLWWNHARHRTEDAAPVVAIATRPAPAPLHVAPDVAKPVERAAVSPPAPAPAAGSDAAVPEPDLPASLAEAIARTPALAADLAKRDRMAGYAVDYQLGLVARLAACVGTQISSRGELSLMLAFDNDPATHRAVGRGFEEPSSGLSAEDDKIVFACLESAHTGHALTTSDRFGSSSSYYLPVTLRFPLREAEIYDIVKRGTLGP